MAHLNLKHLRYFWTVATHGSIARGAKVLHLTPLAFVLSYIAVQVYYVRSLHNVAQEVRASFVIGLSHSR